MTPDLRNLCPALYICIKKNKAGKGRHTKKSGFLSGRTTKVQVPPLPQDPSGSTVFNWKSSKMDKKTHTKISVKFKFDNIFRYLAKQFS